MRKMVDEHLHLVIEAERKLEELVYIISERKRVLEHFKMDPLAALAVSMGGNAEWFLKEGFLVREDKEAGPCVHKWHVSIPRDAL